MPETKAPSPPSPKPGFLLDGLRACEALSLDPISEHHWLWRWIARGTNTGDYRGLPSTGRALVFPGCEYIEVRDDKIHRIEGHFDRMTISGQLGLVPSRSDRTAT